MASIRYRLQDIARRMTPTVTVPRRFQHRADFEYLHRFFTKRQGQMALRYCMSWAKDPSKKGPLLMGPSGCGKTHLIWATARALRNRIADAVESARKAIEERLAEAMERNLAADETGWPDPVDVIVADGAQIAHEIRESVRNNDLDRVIAYYRQEHYARKGWGAFLFLDDLEVMKMSDWLHEELYRIFDFRYAEAIPMMAASNLSPEELRSHLGDRLARRILDMTEPFVL